MLLAAEGKITVTTQQAQQPRACNEIIAVSCIPLYPTSIRSRPFPLRLFSLSLYFLATANYHENVLRNSSSYPENVSAIRV
jgi:hypothetical protein